SWQIGADSSAAVSILQSIVSRASRARLPFDSFSRPFWSDSRMSAGRSEDVRRIRSSRLFFRVSDIRGSSTDSGSAHRSLEFNDTTGVNETRLLLWSIHTVSEPQHDYPADTLERTYSFSDQIKTMEEAIVRLRHRSSEARQQACWRL